MCMTRELLIDKINDTHNFDKKKIINWVKAMPSSYSSRTQPISFRVGDVLYHPIFQHPYVLLEYCIDHWKCGLLTSNSECDDILCDTESRFFSDSYFTNVLFTVGRDIDHQFRGVYENKRHLKKVLKNLKEILK